MPMKDGLYKVEFDVLEKILEDISGNVILTPKESPKYDVRAIIKRSEELGRPLTAYETDEFIIVSD